MVAGEADSFKDFQDRREVLLEVDDIVFHPDHKLIHISRGRTHHFPDLAILKLKKPLNLRSPYTRDVCLPHQGTEMDWNLYKNETDKTKTARNCFVGGFGKGSRSELEDPGSFYYSKGKRTMNSGDINVVEWWQCKGRPIWKELTFLGNENSLCMRVTHDHGTRPCQGDSGSPVVCKEDGGVYIQYGIVSNGRVWSCGSNDLTISVKVSHYSDWINEQVVKLSSTNTSSVTSDILHYLWVILAVSCSWLTFV